ncbi:hypothetical protein GOBAR_AA07798 [Gossypium barbadense]|uniref:Uncharacterized protein n=1 Tax=Gossypium barbadense TaxID=3634 RepID=A0A2P5YB86_GOSBA|nr:hypothetical protein GOBAR_AA07798 [Gossypium barbadense]
MEKETEMFKRLKKVGKRTKVVEQSGSSDDEVYRKACFNAAKMGFPAWVNGLLEFFQGS